MRRFNTIFAMATFALFSMGSVVLAQQEGHHCEYAQIEQAEVVQHGEMTHPMACPMMQMMQGMMGADMPYGRMMDEVKACECMEDGPGLKALHGIGCLCMYEKYADELGLSEEQMAKLRSIRAEHKKVVVRKKADIEIAEIEFGEILHQDTFDFSKARTKISEIGSLKQDIQLDRLSSMEKGQKVLTKEQLATFKGLRKQACCGMMGGSMIKKPEKKCERKCMSGEGR